MLRGHIDGVTSSGYVEGWACDSRNPVSARVISIFDAKGTEHASGFAHRFRMDLAEQKMGTGWHGFRLRIQSTAKLRRSKLILVDREARKELHLVERPHLLDDGFSSIDSVETLLRTDPTMISSIDELKGCDAVFNSVISRRGVEAFVKLAYVYILGRAADPVGIALYSKKLRRGEISCFHLIQILSDSDEFRSRPRLLTSPTASGFPFE